MKLESAIFEQAKRLGIKVFEMDRSLGDVIAMYGQPGIEEYWIFVNPESSEEQQEKACALLIDHHTKHPGEHQGITIEDLQEERMIGLA